MFVELHDARELGKVEARSADERTIHVGLAHESGDVRRLDRSSIEDTGGGFVRVTVGMVRDDVAAVGAALAAAALA